MTDASPTSEPEKLLPGQHWQHVKRGTTYEVIGLGELQMQSDLVDGSLVVIYRGDDGKLWAREEGEFLDGRFRLSSPVSGTDMVRVAAQALADRFPHDMPDYAPAYDEVTALRRALSASPSTPIPVIAEAGEREDEHRTADEAVDFVFDLLAKKLRLAEWQVVEGSEEWEGDVSATLSRLLIDAGIVDDETGAIAALSTPATLDNTAVEGQS